MNDTAGQKGQMMILIVVIISAMALGAVALNNFIMVSELRQVTDARLSGAAIFAADSGIECILFHEFGNDIYASVSCPNPPAGPGSYSDVQTLPNGSTFSYLLVSQTPLSSVWRSVGVDGSGKSTRSLQITLISR